MVTSSKNIEEGWKLIKQCIDKGYIKNGNAVAFVNVLSVNGACDPDKHCFFFGDYIRPCL